jgi:DNA-binding NtrC family response regulator
MKKIMLVDDDAVLLQCLTELLEKFQYAVMAFSRAEVALAALADGTHVDLVITDYRMQGMDGVQFLYGLRSLRPDVPAVVLTAHGTLDGYLKAKDLGAIEFLQKPVKARDLVRTIDENLSCSSSTTSVLDRVTKMIQDREDGNA